MIRYIFLDIDGVFNSNEFYVRTRTGVAQSNIKPYPWCEFDENAVNRFNTIIDTFPDINVVISSSWRHDPRLPDTFSKIGIKISDYSITPYLGSLVRGQEIKKWLDKKAVGEYKYCVVDDDNDMLDEQLENFVQTDYMDGLTDSDMNKIIEILK